jgi:hypothetical protein
MPCHAIDAIVPVVDPSAFVHETALLIGDVIVGPFCCVRPLASLRGDFRAPSPGGEARIRRMETAGRCGRRWRMKKPTRTQRRERAPSDLLGAVCFVVLIAVVAYAALTAT